MLVHSGMLPTSGTTSSRAQGQRREFKGGGTKYDSRAERAKKTVFAPPPPLLKMWGGGNVVAPPPLFPAFGKVEGKYC